MKNKSFAPFLLSIFILPLVFTNCGNSNSVDITSHKVNAKADSLYKMAMKLSAQFDSLEPVYKSIELLNAAIKIDSLNPDYHRVKAKLVLELGNLNDAIDIQKKAIVANAMNGESWFQLGLFQTAVNDSVDSKESLNKSVKYFDAIMKEFPDSLGAYYLRQIALSLLAGNDSIYMPDYIAVEKMFPARKAEIEFIRRIVPSVLVNQISYIGTAQDEESLIFE